VEAVRMRSADRRYPSRERLIELLGTDAAARVVEVFSGKRVYVPEPDTESYARIASRIGDEIARKLCVEFGGTQILLPRRLVPINAKIIELSQQSFKPTEIAQRLCCTESYVYYVLAKERHGS
jgi:hypothetical protein